MQEQFIDACFRIKGFYEKNRVIFLKEARDYIRSANLPGSL